jgi:hypothetical protein
MPLGYSLRMPILCSARASLTPLIASLIITVWSPVAVAQATRVYFLPSSDSGEVAGAIESARSSFVGPLTRAREFVVASDIEMERLIAECREEIGVSPTEERRCRLMQARREFVAYVFQLEGTRLGDRHFNFATEVIDPGRAEIVFSANQDVEGEELLIAVRQGMTLLADDFIAWASGEVGGSSGILEVMHIAPVRNASLCVDGIELGTVPNQYAGLLEGRVRVELSAVGYLPFSTTLVLSEGEITELPEVVFGLIPGVVHVTSNVHDADIEIDGRLAGRTIGNRGTVRFELEPGDHDIVVVRRGWSVYSETINLGPNDFVAVSVNLEPVGR